MKHIFGLATKVLIYIGETDNQYNSDRAMRVIADIEGDPSDAQERSMAALWKRSWFSRIWIVQEVALSRCAVVICGSQTVSWDCFSRWPLRKSTGGDGRLPGVLNYAPGYTPSTRADHLLMILHDNRGAGATDPRDLIFGVLGLLDPSSHDIQVDYSMTTESVYNSVALSIIHQSDSLSILSAAGCGNTNHLKCSLEGLSLPSWVPDWRVAQPTVSLTLGKTFVEPFDAGGRYNTIIRKTTDSTLRVIGVKAGAVNDLYKSGDHYKSAKRGIPGWRKDELAMIQDWSRVVDRPVSLLPSSTNLKTKPISPPVFVIGGTTAQ